MMENQTTMGTGEHTFLHAVALDDSLQDDLRRRFLFRRHLIMSSRFSSLGSLRRFHSQKFVLVLLFVLALITAGCSSGSAVIPLAPTSTVTSDEQAANGPLVGDTSKYASEQTCATNENNQPWYATITAFEHHDSNRSHVSLVLNSLGRTQKATTRFMPTRRL